MLRIFLFFFIVITGCTASIFSGHQSEWLVLSKAKEISCHKWPILNSDISTDHVRIVPGLGTHGYFSKVTTRNFKEAYYSHLFPDNYELSEAMLRALNMPSESSWIGGGNGLWGSVATHILDPETGDSRSIVNIHSLLGNHRPRPVSLADQPDQVWLQEAPGGLWLISEKNNKFQMFLIRIDPVGQNPPKVIPISGSFPDKPFPAGDPLTQGSWIIYTENKVIHPDDETPLSDQGEQRYSGDSVSFRWQKLQNNSTYGEVFTLPLPENQGIEAWTVRHDGRAFTLAYIEGDSLIGHSSLIVAHFELESSRPQRKWIKTYPLENIHVDKPFWAGYGDTARLFLMQWVDGEATIGDYRTSSAGMRGPLWQGVFPGGSTLMDTFVDRKTGLAYALVRFRENTHWQFELCELQED